VNLVQIGLPRAGARAPAPHDAAEDDHEAASEPVPDDSLLPASAGLALAGGLVVLAPLAAAALVDRSALVVLLVGLVGLGLIAALLRPGLVEVDPP
jgi:hypothetical protein